MQLAKFSGTLLALIVNTFGLLSPSNTNANTTVQVAPIRVPDQVVKKQGDKVKRMPCVSAIDHRKLFDKTQNLCLGYRNSNLYVALTTKKGRGVFTNTKILRGETIERAPVIVVPDHEGTHLDKTQLRRYVFLWKNNGAAVGLGLTSLYNHASEPNLSYSKHMDGNFIDIIARRDIYAGEELTVSYVSGYKNPQCAERALKKHWGILE